MAGFLAHFIITNILLDIRANSTTMAVSFYGVHSGTLHFPQFIRLCCVQHCVFWASVNRLCVSGCVCVCLRAVKMRRNSSKVFMQHCSSHNTWLTQISHVFVSICARADRRSNPGTSEDNRKTEPQNNGTETRTKNAKVEKFHSCSCVFRSIFGHSDQRGKWMEFMLRKIQSHIRVPRNGRLPAHNLCEVIHWVRHCSA